MTFWLRDWSGLPTWNGVAWCEGRVVGTPWKAEGNANDAFIYHPSFCRLVLVLLMYHSLDVLPLDILLEN